MRVFRLSALVIVAAIPNLCSRQPEIPSGNYRRTAYMVLDRSGKVMKTDPIGEAIPPAIRISAKHIYEVDARITRMRGTYRVERDSVFFDDRGPNGAVVVSFFGIVNGDTLQLRAPTVLMALGAEPGMELIMNFVREPTLRP